MKRAQLELAARLWSLALIAHTETDIDESEGGNKVRTLAAKRAKGRLRNLCVSPGEILSAEDAIAKAADLLAPKV